MTDRIERYQEMPGRMEREGLSERERILADIKKIELEAPAREADYKFTKTLLELLKAIADGVEKIEKKGYFVDAEYDSRPPLFVSVYVEREGKRKLLFGANSEYGENPPLSPDELIEKFNAAESRLRALPAENSARGNVVEIKRPPNRMAA